MKILYYDCFAGISGDMNLAAMIDLGIDPGYLVAELGKLGLSGYRFETSRAQRAGITGTRVDVLPEREAGVIGHGDHDPHGHPESRSYADITGMIRESSLDQAVKATSLEIFRILGEAEAKIHNQPLDQIHFHEVGAVDSIVDIVGAAICYHALGVDRVLASRVELGGGFVKTAHGLLPVPAPATSEILKDVPVSTGKVMQETTTPTGAAILAALVDEFTVDPAFTISKTAYGIGHRETEIPNLLRVYLGEMKDRHEDDSSPWLIECNIDDMNPEFYGHIADLLFTKGADDVFFTPIIMKKGRPATKLSVLVDPTLVEVAQDILFRETTTLGLRKTRIEKTMLTRDEKLVHTRFGDIQVKLAFYQGNLIRMKPEFEACKKAADVNRLPLQAIYDEVKRVYDGEGNR